MRPSSLLYFFRMNKLSGWFLIVVGFIVLINPFNSLNIIPFLIGFGISASAAGTFYRAIRGGRFSFNSLLVVLIGIALMLATDATLTWASMATAIIIIGLGVSNIIGFRRRRYPREELRFNGGLLMVVVGFIWFLLPDLPFLLFRTVIGLLLILVGILQLSTRQTIFQRSTWNATIKQYMSTNPKDDPNIIDVDVDDDK